MKWYKPVYEPKPLKLTRRRPRKSNFLMLTLSTIILILSVLLFYFIVKSIVPRSKTESLNLTNIPLPPTTFSLSPSTTSTTPTTQQLDNTSSSLAYIYLIKVLNEEDVELIPVEVSIKKLTPKTLFNALRQAGDKRYKNFIPSNLKLISYKISGSLITLNLGEEIRLIPPYTFELALAQLIATFINNFSRLGVKNLKILVEGKDVDYLDSEGLIRNQIFDISFIKSIGD